MSKSTARSWKTLPEPLNRPQPHTRQSRSLATRASSLDEVEGAECILSAQGGTVCWPKISRRAFDLQEVLPQLSCEPREPRVVRLETST